MLQNVSSAQDMDDTHTIVQFLQRPVKLENFQIRQGDSAKPLRPVVFKTTEAQTPVKTYTLPRDIIIKGNKLEKMVNHQFFKADIKIKIVLNANPFVSGRFYLTYSPYEEQVSNSRKQIMASRAGVTAYPGVEIDAQLDNSVEMCIPFASYKESYVLTNDKPEDFVKLYLFCIAPVRTGSGGQDAVIDMTVYAWFENITLNIPTCKPLPLLESKYTKEVVVERRVEVKDRISRRLDHLELRDPERWNRIMNILNNRDDSTNHNIATRSPPTVVRKPRDVASNWIQAEMQIQAEAQEVGPITKLATSVSGVASKLEGVPIVGEVAGTVGWVADLVGGIASIFGWSRPQSMQAIQDLVNVPGKNYSHCNAIDNSVSLSLSNQNELGKPANIFPSAVDEMDISYVCANPAIKYIYPWTTNTAENPRTKARTIGVIPVGIGPFDRYSDTSTKKVYDTGPIWEVELQPECKNSWPFWDGKSTRPITGSKVALRYTQTPMILDTAPCEYISQLFTYWRATMCFKVSVVKTAFHVGRLEIFFDPGYYFSKGDQIDYKRYDDVDSANNYKYILDLTNDTEITIKIPFVSEQLFKNTISANQYITTPLDAKNNLDNIFNSLIGSLIIRPVSNLLAPETVSDTVDIVVWKWAEDVVFGVPKNATQSDFHIYSPPQSIPEPPPLPISQQDLKNFFGTIPDETALCTMKDSVPFSCDVRLPWEEARRIKARAQINISNKADGNVEVFFQTERVEANDMLACINAMGERLVSLRPLLRAFRKIGEVTTNPGLPIKFSFQDDLTSNIASNKFAAEDLRSPSPDYSSILSYMYRFFRGGNRLKFFADAVNKTTSAYAEGFDAIAKIVSNVSDVKILDKIDIGPTHTTYPDLNPIHEITIPFYSKFRKLPISIEDDILSASLDSNVPVAASIYRAGNDDLTFGWLMGTPQLSLGIGAVTFHSWYATAYEGGGICTPTSLKDEIARYKADMQIDVPDRLGYIPQDCGEIICPCQPGYIDDGDLAKMFGYLSKFDEKSNVHDNAIDMYKAYFHYKNICITHKIKFEDLEPETLQQDHMPDKTNLISSFNRLCNENTEGHFKNFVFYLGDTCIKMIWWVNYYNPPPSGYARRWEQLRCGTAWSCS